MALAQEAGNGLTQKLTLQLNQKVEATEATKEVRLLSAEEEQTHRNGGDSWKRSKHPGPRQLGPLWIMQQPVGHEKSQAAGGAGGREGLGQGQGQGRPCTGERTAGNTAGRWWFRRACDITCGGTREEEEAPEKK